MERGADSDYIGSLSLMGGFGTGINFDGFGENMEKFMELSIKYLDSAHDKAVGLVEDIHALICSPLPDDEVPNKGHGTLKDPSSNNVITGSSSTSVKMELVDPDEEFSSPPTSLITAEDSFMGSIGTDAHETESFSTKFPENTSSEGGHIEVNDQCMLPEDTSITEICDSCTSEDAISLGKTVSIKEEVILYNSEKPSDSCTREDPISLGRTFSIEEEVILWNPGNSVKPPQPPESSACNGAILHGKISANGEEQSELYSANDSEESTKHGNIMDLSGGTISHDLSAHVFNATDDTIKLDDIMQYVDIDPQDDQEGMKNHKAEVSSVPQPKNTLFKKIFMRSLSNKLWWSKKDMNVHQTVPVRSQEVGDVRCQSVSSLDGLEDDWELL